MKVQNCLAYADTFSTMRSNWVEDIITKYGSTAHVIASIDEERMAQQNTGLPGGGSLAAIAVKTWRTHPSATALTDQS